jgi:hypothetical protein
MNRMSKLLIISSIVVASPIYCQTIELNGSPFATEGAPVPEHLSSNGEKTILIDPRLHAWGAYNAKGRLIRWGIATTGSNHCRDTGGSCRTDTGTYRLYSLGGKNCSSSKYPLGTGGAPMPYCMYFSGSQAIHGSYEVESANASHGCVRVHVADAEWLRFKFAEGPNASNHYQGTRVIIRPY